MTALQGRGPGSDGILKVAIYAVGGQGGGVLTGWIETLARAQGYDCQATSVAGVSQRTGATIYYVEMAKGDGGVPVFSLMPAAGDVDVMIAAEWMEAGRAILRGFVTPDRTTLIASTHRNLAVSEKIVPGDGLADAETVREAALQAARRLIRADFEAAATGAGSVISASLFGALAASETLPFPRAAFEAAIRSGGRGVEASLRAFAAGFAAATADRDPQAGPAARTAAPAVTGPAGRLKAWHALADRAALLPAPASEMALAGLRKVVDFQDCRYGGDYLDWIERIAGRDSAPWDLTREAAKHLANAMCYDDVIRVADLKTRAVRFRRIRSETGASDGQVLQVTEYLHPRAEEVAGLLPRPLGQWVTGSPARMRRLGWLFRKGNRLRSDSLWGFLRLYLLAGMKPWRRMTLRHGVEMRHLETWLATALAYHDRNPDLAVEVIRCRRLVKGYSDTHARGLSKYDKALQGIALVAGRSDAADWARRLREAALKDAAGKELDGALRTIRSFA